MYEVINFTTVTIKLHSRVVHIYGVRVSCEVVCGALIWLDFITPEGHTHRITLPETDRFSSQQPVRSCWVILTWPPQFATSVASVDLMWKL